MTLPLIVGFLAATADYGWYFLQEGQITMALRESVRSGSFQSPADTDSTGECSPCVSRAGDLAVAELSDLGITVPLEDVTPTMENVSDTCALVLEPSLSFTPLVGLLPTPDHYRVRVVAFAQNVEGC